METLHKCTDCKLDKKSEEFNKCKFKSNGLQGKCRECEKLYRENNKDRIRNRMKKYRKTLNSEIINGKQRTYYLKIKEKELERGKRYREENRELVNERARKRYDKEERHERYEKNRERDLNQTKEWRKNNRNQYREYQRTWIKNKRATDPHYLIQHRLRNRLLTAIKDGKGKKLAPMIELVGCSLKELKIYLENQFTEGMNWEQVYNGNIEIDHIKPCCSFNLAILEDQKTCFYYTNLRPLWKENNKDKIKEDLKMSLKLINKKSKNNSENIDFL